ncbi:conserved hypothetical protein [Burkholderia sp. 8Y]|uniref:hypothetical protein n=1 Tax=Burkholderia sp. 8Y TaxID=2653133 RepID=UPI0012F24546|nr:hypothetical protein [Burkholderia sp. 8Y]VXC82549.1 conserved hypothetical protein [Burkholderia sp. 8Y]
MTGTIEIKLTVSEVVTPALFAALMAVSNPRQRAALLKRLADEALRSSGTAGLVYTAEPRRTVVQQADVADIGATPAETQAKPASVEERKPQKPVESAEQPSETTDDEHLNYLADSLSAFA